MIGWPAVVGRCGSVARPDTDSAALALFRGKASETDVVLNLRTRVPSMAMFVTGACRALPSPAPTIRVLRWTFRRDEEAVICELGLNSDDSAYELRITAPWTPAGTTSELFDDATSAFQRHTAIERSLVNGGWMLEAFESEQVAR